MATIICKKNSALEGQEFHMPSVFADGAVLNLKAAVFEMSRDGQTLTLSSEDTTAKGLIGFEAVEGAAPLRLTQLLRTKTGRGEDGKLGSFRSTGDFVTDVQTVLKSQPAHATLRQVVDALNAKIAGRQVQITWTVFTAKFDGTEYDAHVYSINYA
jgi:hypothetical protein